MLWTGNSNFILTRKNTLKTPKQTDFNGLQIGVTGEPHITLGIYQYEKYFSMLATCNTTYRRNYLH